MGPREDPQVDIYNNALYHKENAPLLEVIGSDSGKNTTKKLSNIWESI